MTTQLTSRTGGQILVDALLGHGVEIIFCVPGESYIAALDALHDVSDRIKLVVCRQEGGAAYMAEAYAKLTGKPGVCFVTRGPGATNASIGIHTAMQDSSPVILLIGQVGTDVTEREAFQEIDYRRMYGQLAKWVAQIERTDRIPEMVSHAFYTAMAGRPGPTVLALPEDVLDGRASVPDAASYKTVRPSPAADDLRQLHDMLQNAQRPMLMLGGGGWNAQAVADMRAFAEAYGMPVVCSFRCQDLYDNHHALYAGDSGPGINPKLGERIRAADLFIAVGPRLGEQTTSGYTLFQVPCPTQTLVHVHASTEELGRVYQPALPINAGMPQFAAAARALPGIAAPCWNAWAAEARADYLAFSEPKAIPGPLQMGEVMQFLRENLPADTILCNGAGNYAVWVHRFFRYRSFRTQLAPTSGSMGYGVPAAIAAKLAAPGRTVVAFAGDGCFLMNGQEMATACMYGLKILFIVVNNGMYGTIRMHQERNYPARVVGTALHNPDFAAMARAFGLHGEVVASTAQFVPAYERAMTHDGPALLELRIDPQAITPSITIDGIRAQSHAGTR